MKYTLETHGQFAYMATRSYGLLALLRHFGIVTSNVFTFVSMDGRYQHVAFTVKGEQDE